jgi:hypothetical protein
VQGDDEMAVRQGDPAQGVGFCGGPGIPFMLLKDGFLPRHESGWWLGRRWYVVEGDVGDGVDEGGEHGPGGGEGRRHFIFGGLGRGEAI